MITILYSALLVILAYKISRMIRKHFLIVLLLSTILSTLSYYFKIDFILTGYLGLSFLIIVMFAGALKKGSYLSKKLKSVRKEYSILGFVFITSHSIYYFVQFWSGLMKYELIGVIAYIIMIPLFITSFSKIRKRVTYKSWQKLHKFSYIAYLLIFIHLLIVGNFENRILYILVFSIYTMVKIVNYLILKGSFYKNMIQAIIIVIVLNLAILNLFSIDLTQKVHYIGKDYSTLQKEDGIYTGTAIGFDELVVEVKVEVKNNKIIHIEVIKDGSTHPEHGIDFHACAIIISENIVEMSSTQIDTISGATSTSTGILKAVDNAIGE